MRPLAVVVCTEGVWIAERERLVLCDLATGAEKRVVTAHAAIAWGFAPDATFAIGIGERSAVVSLATGSATRIELAFNARSVSISADGTRAAIASENECIAWDVTAGAKIWRRAAVDEVCAISPDGARIAFGANPPPGIAVVPPVPRAKGAKLAGRGLTGMAWLPDGTLVTAHGAQGVKLWDGAQPRSLAPHAATNLAAAPGRVAFSAAGEIIEIEVATGVARTVGRGVACAYAPQGIAVVGETVALVR